MKVKVYRSCIHRKIRLFFACLSIHRYLVDCRWFKQWKKFVGFDTWDQFGIGDQLNHPGPIDNSSLVAGTVCYSISCTCTVRGRNYVLMQH